MSKIHLALLSLTLLAWFPGCALIGFEQSEGDLDMTDPVVRAALAARSPASIGSESGGTQHGYAVQMGRLNREVVPGMDMSDVRSVLGEPLDVETAGDSQDGNQRWVYSDGYRGQLNGPSRVVYFEQGKVAGWRNYDSR